jgi:predicted TIM-barrel fold metal-dependent hydrolase
MGGESLVVVRAIDSHVHLYPPEVNGNPAGWAEANGERRWSDLCTRLRDGRPVQGFPSVDQLLRSLDSAGVERAVLLGWYWENPASCVLQNRFYAQCIRLHPDRLTGCATVHPAAGSAAVREEIRRACGEGLAGLGELSPHSQGFPIGDGIWGEALELAAQLRLPVNLHVTAPEGRSYPGRVATPIEDFLTIARQFPRTNFILAHWGGLLPLRIPAAAAQPNLYYDTAASPLIYDSAIWRRFATLAGQGRVLFGSDYPLNLYPALGSEPEIGGLVSEARASGLADGELDALLRGNAEKLLFLHR